MFLSCQSPWRQRDELFQDGGSLERDLGSLSTAASSVSNAFKEMHCFLMRLVEARNGQITGMQAPISKTPPFGVQELVHWAGTICVGRGELEITFDELLEAMHELWFIDMPLKPVVKKASLVYVGDAAMLSSKFSVDLISSDSC